VRIRCTEQQQDKQAEVNATSTHMETGSELRLSAIQTNNSAQLVAIQPCTLQTTREKSENSSQHCIPHGMQTAAKKIAITWKVPSSLRFERGYASASEHSSNPKGC